MPTRATQHLSLFADGVGPLIDNLLNGVRNLSDHWAVVIGISLVFFVVQTILSMKLFAQAWDQDRLLRMLRREFLGIPPEERRLVLCETLLDVRTRHVAQHTSAGARRAPPSLFYGVRIPVNTRP